MERLTIRPSSSGRWVHCPASVAMSAINPPRRPVDIDQPDDAMIGTAAHEIASICLSSYQDRSPNVVLSSQFLGKTIDKVVITDSILEGVDFYVNYILNFAGVHGCMSGFNFEKRIDLNRFGDTVEGTPDCYFLDTVNKKCYVFDFKNGVVPVDAFENRQMLMYAVGIIDNYTGNNLYADNWDIELIIVQPNVFKGDQVKSFISSIKDCEYLIGDLCRSADNALSASPVCKSGSHCKDCPAMLNCIENQNAVHRSVAFARVQLVGNLKHDEIADIWRELNDAKSLIINKLSSLESEAVELIKEGSDIAGLSVQDKYSNLKWLIGIDELKTVADLMCIKLTTDKAITPTAAKKLLPPELIETYAGRVKTGVILTDSAKTKTAEYFSNYNKKVK